MKLSQKGLDTLRKNFRLSPRQAEVINILLSGKVTTREIAEELKVTPGAARQFIYQIHTKMRTESKGQLLVRVFDFIVENEII